MSLAGRRRGANIKITTPLRPAHGRDDRADGGRCGMIVLFLSLTFANLACLHHHRDSRLCRGATSWHRLAGALAPSSCCGCALRGLHFIFIATGKWISTRSWSKGSIRKSRCPQRAFKAAAFGRPGLDDTGITTAIIGAAVDNQYLSPPGITCWRCCFWLAIWALLRGIPRDPR